MKVLSFAIFLIIASSLSAESDFSRYQIIIDRSPFGSSGEIILPVIPPGVVEEISGDYLLTGIIIIGKVKKAIIENRKRQEHYYLKEGDSIERIKLFSIDEKEAKVVLLKGGKLIRIGFVSEEKKRGPLRSFPKRIPKRRKARLSFPPKQR